MIGKKKNKNNRYAQEEQTSEGKTLTNLKGLSQYEPGKDIFE